MALDGESVDLSSHGEALLLQLLLLFPPSKLALTFFAGIKFFNFRQQDSSQRFHLVLWNAGAVIIDCFLFCQMITSHAHKPCFMGWFRSVVPMWVYASRTSLGMRSRTATASWYSRWSRLLHRRGRCHFGRTFYHGSIHHGRG